MKTFNEFLGEAHKPNWFPTLQAALESEDLVDQWELGVNISYGQTVRLTSADGTELISVYRETNGMYERPVHYKLKTVRRTKLKESFEGTKTFGDNVVEVTYLNIMDTYRILVRDTKTKETLYTTIEKESVVKKMLAMWEKLPDKSFDMLWLHGEKIKGVKFTFK